MKPYLGQGVVTELHRSGGPIRLVACATGYSPGNIGVGLWFIWNRVIKMKGLPMFPPRFPLQQYALSGAIQANQTILRCCRSPNPPVDPIHPILSLLPAAGLGVGALLRASDRAGLGVGRRRSGTGAVAADVGRTAPGRCRDAVHGTGGVDSQPERSLPVGIDGISALFPPLTALLFCAVILASWTSIQTLPRLVFRPACWRWKASPWACSAPWIWCCSSCFGS